MDAEEFKAIREELKTMNLTLAVNTALLEVHIKRTEINEKRVEKLEYWLLGALGAIILMLGRSLL